MLGLCRQIKQGQRTEALSQGSIVADAKHTIVKNNPAHCINDPRPKITVLRQHNMVITCQRHCAA
jgi:hypothetical protein